MNIKFKTSMLKSNLCDYSDTYIVVEGRVRATGINNVNRRNNKLTFKKNGTLRSCIAKINNTYIENAEDLGIVMTTYNLLEYSDNYFTTSGNL